MMQFAHHPGMKANVHNCPKHIAIIMDGNGRWARLRNYSRSYGHRKGVETVKEVIAFCLEKQIPVLTLFAFGVENWKRPTQEVRNLFRLFFLILKRELGNLHRDNIQLRIIGDKTRLTPFLQKAIRDAQEQTASNTRLILNLAINYSGRWDLVQAIDAIRESDSLGQNEGVTQTDTETLLEKNLSLAGLPDPDLFIRTGGVQRISNFLLWNLAYTELYFSDILWPDFSRDEMEKALVNFASRERRFGLTGEQIE